MGKIQNKIFSKITDFDKHRGNWPCRVQIWPHFWAKLTPSFTVISAIFVGNFCAVLKMTQRTSTQIFSPHWNSGYLSQPIICPLSSISTTPLWNHHYQVFEVACDRYMYIDIEVSRLVIVIELIQNWHNQNRYKLSKLNNWNYTKPQKTNQQGEQEWR